MTEQSCGELLLEVKNLSFAYKAETPILEDFNFSLTGGEIAGFTGASGCGKTTLFYCLSGIIPKVFKGNYRGQILLKGKPLEELSLARTSAYLGMVFQNPDQQLFSDNVLEDIVFGPENLCVPKTEMEERLAFVCDLLPVEPLLYKKVSSLSGGQKQMAAIASALAMKPDVLLFDEAFSQLDGEGRTAVANAILRLRDEGCGIMMIDHSEENLKTADRIFRMKKGASLEQRIY